MILLEVYMPIRNVDCLMTSSSIINKKWMVRTIIDTFLTALFLKLLIVQEPKYKSLYIVKQKCGPEEVKFSVDTF